MEAIHGLIFWVLDWFGYEIVSVDIRQKAAEAVVGIIFGVVVIGSGVVALVQATGTTGTVLSGAVLLFGLAVLLRCGAIFRATLRNAEEAA